MGATFPNGIASFKTHVDSLDAIEASDINKIQDELVAVQEALGAALTTIVTTEDEVDVLEGDEVAQQSFNRMVFTEFDNLTKLINSLWDGQNVYAAEASAANVKLGKTPSNRPYPPARVNLTKPGSDDDPMGMWNGTGFTLKKSGFWMLHGQIQVNLQTTGPGNNDNFGTYEGSVTLNANNWTRGLDRRYPVVDGQWHDVMLTPSILGWFPAGTAVTLRAAQSSNLNQNIKSAHLSVYRVRGR